jgi:hypothetical protein
MVLFMVGQSAGFIKIKKNPKLNFCFFNANKNYIKIK